MSMQRYNRRPNYAAAAYSAARTYAKYDPSYKVIKAAYNYATAPASTVNTGAAQPVRAKSSKRHKPKRKPKGKTARKIKR